MAHCFFIFMWSTWITDCLRYRLFAMYAGMVCVFKTLFLTYNLGLLSCDRCHFSQKFNDSSGEIVSKAWKFGLNVTDVCVQCEIKSQWWVFLTNEWRQSFFLATHFRLALGLLDGSHPKVSIFDKLGNIKHQFYLHTNSRFKLCHIHNWRYISRVFIVTQSTRFSWA